MAADIDNILKRSGFTEADIPTGEYLARANRSSKEYGVSTENGHLRIEPAVHRSKADSNIYTYGPLTYIGMNKGEWIGSLKVISPDKKEKVLISENIIAMVPYKDGLYVFTGLYHLSFNEGAVYRIKNLKSNPVVKKVATLPQATHAILLDKKNKTGARFVIVTSSGITILDPEKNDIRVLSKSLFWSILYPNSVERVGENQYIVGMRSGVALVEFDHRQIKNVRYYKK